MSPRRPLRGKRDVTREGLFVEHRLHLRTQTIEAAPHVGHPGSQPDLRPGAEFNHLRRLSRIERNSFASAPISTPDRRPTWKLGYG